MAGIGLGRLLGMRACFNSPEWGGGSSPVKNGASPDCIIVVVVFCKCVSTRCLCRQHRRMNWQATPGGLTPGSPTPGVSTTPRALDDEELFIVEGSQKVRRRPGLNSVRRSPKKMPQNAAKRSSPPPQTSITEAEAPPTVCANLSCKITGTSKPCR